MPFKKDLCKYRPTPSSEVKIKDVCLCATEMKIFKSPRGNTHWENEKSHYRNDLGHVLQGLRTSDSSTGKKQTDLDQMTSKGNL